MGRWCPRCRAEYVEGWRSCSSCGVELVDEPPPFPEPEGEPSFLEPGGQRGEDPFVAIWEGPAPEGSALARELEEALIPVELGEAAGPGSVRIEVPRSYVDEAYGILDEAGEESGPAPGEPGVPEAWGPEDQPDPWEQPRLPWGRVALALVALVLIVLLVLTSR